MLRDMRHRDGLAGLVDLDRAFELAGDAMRGSEHEVRCERCRGAEVFTFVDQHDDRACREARRRRRVAGDGKSNGTGSNRRQNAEK